MLEVQSLTKRFGGLTAVDNVTLSVERGEIRALIGPNGSGKSTMLNLISAVYIPNSGTILFKGKSALNQRPHRLVQAGMKRTFQTSRLFRDLTVLENVMVGLHGQTRAGLLGIVFSLPAIRREEMLVREKSLEALSLVGLFDQADLLSKNLPYGQQRLLEIARGLVSAPDLLLLDEPAAGMNPSETVQLVTLLRNIRQRGVTILLVEHDMSLVMRLSDRISVLNFGRKIAEGSPRDIQNDEDVIQAYLGRKVRYA